jgi:hypothetical protein
MKLPVVVDIISGVVADVRARYDLSALPEKPYFMHGHLQEIINTLIEKDKSNVAKYKKYPVIILVQDFPESITPESHDATITVIIATQTQSQIKASDRYAKTFKPVLIPLAEMFLEELGNSTNINQATFTFTKTDRLYWGTNNANTGGDYIDAIEISDLKIRLLNHC